MKLVVAGHEFYSMARGEKRIEYRTSKHIIDMIKRNHFEFVKIYHGYFEKSMRPYLVKELRTCVMVPSGVCIRYPNLHVTTTRETCCLVLGSRLTKIFDPQPDSNKVKYTTTVKRRVF